MDVKARLAGAAVIMLVCEFLAFPSNIGDPRPPAAADPPVSLADRPSPVSPQAAEASADLRLLLEKAAAYCRRLESSVLDFVCREAVEEEVDASKDSLKVRAPVPTWVLPKNMPSMSVQSNARYRVSCVYDYQCVRAEGRIKERRILLLQNGKKKNEPDAPLLISSLAYRNAMLGPVNLFSERNQARYGFKPAGRAKYEKRPVVVVEATPRADEVDPLCLTGKAWIDPQTGDILRIEWTQKPSANPEIFEDRAKRAKGRLRLTVRTEFSEEKNGLRFPSRIWIQEAYVRERGRAFVRSETDVVYKDFKFFTVETEVRGNGR